MTLLTSFLGANLGLTLPQRILMLLGVLLLFLATSMSHCMICMRDSATFRKIYNVAAPFPKSDYYEPFRVPGPNIDIFVEKNETLHGKFKRQFSHVYSATGVKDLDANIDGSIKKFIAQMQKTKGTNIDLGKWFERLLFDCMCDLTFEQNQGYIDSSPEDNPFGAVARFVRQAHLYGMTPALFYFAKASQFVTEKLFRSKRKPDASSRSIEAFLRGFKDPSNVHRGKAQRNIASKLFQVQASKSSNSLTDEEVAHLVDFGVKAGVTDGSAWLNSVFYHLIHNRDKLDKLVQELDQKLNAGKLDTICTSQQAAACPYLNAVLQEAQRMFPSIGGILPRETPSGGKEILGQHIPAGVTIGAPAFAISRMPEVFGADTSSFIPERWLDVGQPNMYLSWLMMRKIVPSLLLSLDFESPDPKSDWTVVSGAGVHQYNFHARVKKREFKE
ncbi:hypothetical protein N7474_006237 [Penicillium riverlandense]|uniref:uncharacterized protein n=1 Tax=Penicillium riverlandense TaxID=1903569 RepID=UPI002549B225|nr:uncharacterized protein N7474_006237 [Penicillium riverlandense]KAJ5820646.1 hypothetical protein N7474_006237 [Penicillium riverlandense]